MKKKIAGFTIVGSLAVMAGGFVVSRIGTNADNSNPLEIIGPVICVIGIAMFFFGALYFSRG